MPQLVFVVTGWKSNGKENACLHSWSSFMGSGLENFICILGKVNKEGHMYQSLRETKVCVLDFPSNFPAISGGGFINMMGLSSRIT